MSLECNTFFEWVQSENYTESPIGVQLDFFLLQYATSCPANLGGRFGRPPEQMSDMAVVEEHDDAARPQEIKSVTALSILESFAKAAAAAPDSEKIVEEDAQSAETSDDSDGEQDVFNLEGLERVRVADNPCLVSSYSVASKRLPQGCRRKALYPLTRSVDHVLTWNIDIEPS